MDSRGACRVDRVHHTTPPARNTQPEEQRPRGCQFGCAVVEQLRDIATSAATSAPQRDVCNHFDSIASFWKGHGYMTERNDGTYSMSDSISGACLRHHGEAREMYRG